MITPRFSCAQTPESVVVSIYCPSIRASDVEIRVDGSLLIVHVSPYYLRLNFSHALLEDEDSSAHYDAGSGYLTVTLTKEVKGQEFRDLDLLAKLLAPPKSSPTRPIIEVLDSQECSDTGDLGHAKISPEQREILEAAENDWLLPQEVPNPMSSLYTSCERPYGFLNLHSGYFRHVANVENEVNELGPEPETCPADERRKRRQGHEEKKWDEEYYMADYADDEVIQELIAWEHPFVDVGDIQYTEEENLAMLRLPRKEYLVSPSQARNIYLTLVTFLFSYAYEARSTQRDFNPESAWTICTLTAATAALDPPPYDAPVRSTDPSSSSPQPFPQCELVATLVPCYRRSLAFPLYRSFAFADACRADVANFLLKGQRTVVRCLLDVKRILDHHEVYYVYSKIWLDDMCVWLQTCASDSRLQELGRLLKETKVEKWMIGWDLEALEAAVHQAQQHDEDDNAP